MGNPGKSTTGKVNYCTHSSSCSSCSTPQVPADQTALSGATSATCDAGSALAETPNLIVGLKEFKPARYSISLIPAGAAGPPLALASELAGATSSFGDTSPDHAKDNAVAMLGAVFLRRVLVARHPGARASPDPSPQAVASLPRLTPPPRQMVKVSLGPAPVRVTCADASGYLWAWRWEDALDFERSEFPDDDGPWAGCGETPPELAEEHMHEFYDYDGDLGLDDFG